MPTTTHDHTPLDLPPFGDLDPAPLSVAIAAAGDNCVSCAAAAVEDIAKNPDLTVSTLMLGYLALVAHRQAEGLDKPHLPAVAAKHSPVTIMVWSALADGEWDEALSILALHEPEVRTDAVIDALDTFTSLMRQFPDASPFAVDPDQLDSKDVPMVQVIDPAGCTNDDTCGAGGHYATCPKFSVRVELTMQRWDPEPDPLDGNTQESTGETPSS